ncbi:MAG TPA: TetR/AcrR family transcriptional regulator [Glaciihabitans sp.]|jgi:AcrR family transcriptional regulator|nr:TetR/AcrR family transcriptional regulator [Glaciihabitans sp.]
MDADDSGTSGTRDRILIAAATMLGEDPTARLSVRAVAARAGVSTGSLRHFFPTQQVLIDTVVAGIYRLAAVGEPIRDTSIPAEDRLIACLQQILGHVGTGEQAREMWRGLSQAYFEHATSANDAETYLALERGGRHHIEQWLHVLRDEGAPVTHDIEGSARFLSSVLNGLSIERALPADGPRATFEHETLRRAVTAVLGADGEAPNAQQL